MMNFVFSCTRFAIEYFDKTIVDFLENLLLIHFDQRIPKSRPLKTPMLHQSVKEKRKLGT